MPPLIQSVASPRSPPRRDDYDRRDRGRDDYDRRDRGRDDYDRRSRGGYGFDDRRAPRGRSRSPRDRYDDRR